MSDNPVQQVMEMFQAVRDEAIRPVVEMFEAERARVARTLAPIACAIQVAAALPTRDEVKA
jgi:hypothetical protein